MNFKGQTELIIIVALMAVIAVVVVTQFSGIITTTESPDVRNARESVEGLIRAAALDTMETMSDHGGYLSPSDFSLGSVSLNDNDVPYWQRSGQTSYPDIAANLQAGVQSYLEQNSGSFGDAMEGISLGDPMVGTPVLRGDSLTLTVNMPATYKETQLPQPFTVTLDTHLGDISEFSRGFVAYESSQRPLEYYTLSSMMLSETENGHSSIPMYEVLMGCGDYLFASSFDIMPRVEKAITKTLAHTYMPGKVPLNTIRTSSSPKYSLVPINGNEYQDLEVSFMLPDEFSLDLSNFRMEPDPAMGFAKPIAMIGECIGDEPITIEYSFDYPVVVRALDPETGNIFQFAVEVSIRQNQPSEWSSLPNVSDEICSAPGCVIELDRVEDSSGNPIEGAYVSFMGCFLGRTDSDGSLYTLAPCGSGTLSVYNRGYGEYLDSRTSSQLSGGVTLQRMPVMNVILHEVVVQDQGDGQYMVYYGDVKPLEDQRAHLTFRSAQDFEERSFYSNNPSLTVSTVPSGEHYVTAVLYSNDFMSINGAMADTHAISEGTTELHIYVPTHPGLNSIQDEVEQRLRVLELTEVLGECGIGPVSEEPYEQEEACAVTIA